MALPCKWWWGWRALQGLQRLLWPIWQAELGILLPPIGGCSSSFPCLDSNSLAPQLSLVQKDHSNLCADSRLRTSCRRRLARSREIRFAHRPLGEPKSYSFGSRTSGFAIVSSCFGHTCGARESSPKPISKWIARLRAGAHSFLKPCRTPWSARKVGDGTKLRSICAARKSVKKFR